MSLSQTTVYMIIAAYRFTLTILCISISFDRRFEYQFTSNMVSQTVKEDCLKLFGYAVVYGKSLVTSASY